MRVLVVVLLALALAVVPGCGQSSCEETRSCSGGGSGGSGGGAGDSGVPDAASGFSLALASGSLTLVEGKSSSVTVTATRQSFDGAIELALVGAPSGVSAGAATIPAGQTSVELTVDAALGATLGSADATVRGSGGGHQTDVPLALTVNGAPGTQDASYGTAGWVSVSWGVGGPPVGPVVTADQGLAFAASYVTVIAPLEVVHVKSDGTLDDGFGSAGKVLFPSVADGNARYVKGITGDAQGKILVTGLVASAGTAYASALRFDSAGALDTSFGTQGELGGPASSWESAFLDADPWSSGKITFAGATVGGSTDNVFVGQSDGAGPDLAFGQSGGTSFDTPGDSAVSGKLARRSDGGHFAVFQLSASSLACSVDATGAPAPGFGVGGCVSNSFVAVVARATASDQLLLGGSAGGQGELHLLAADGTPDPSWGTSGVLGGLGSAVVGLSFDGQGRVLVLAKSAAGLRVYRFSPAGAPDSEFNGTGNVELTTASVPFGIETLSDGRIMVAAYEQTGTSYDLRIARIWP